MKKIRAYLYPTPAELLKRDLDARRTKVVRDTYEELLRRVHGAKLCGLWDDPYAGYVGLDLACTCPFEYGPGEQPPKKMSAEKKSALLARQYGVKTDNGGFVWVTHKGQAYRVKDMAAPHIYYSLRMVFNHSVPPAFRVGEFKRYPDVAKWPETYREAAITAFVRELKLRADKSVADGGLDKELKYEFEDMQANARAILDLGL